MTLDLETLPDLLAPDLDVVFVGINPSTYSVARGHYFARRQNRFWPAFSRSRLSEPARAGLARDTLEPEDDARLLAFGFGFTDVVKRPSSNASGLRGEDFAEWTPRLRARLAPLAPRLICFHGLMAYRPFVRYGLTLPVEGIRLGPQSERLDGSHIFVVPNPSPANAHVSLDGQVAWYDRVAELLRLLRGRQTH